jgi:hypothetical protein
MKNVKCRQCRFVNSEFAETCRKCKVTLRNTFNYLANPKTNRLLDRPSHVQMLKNDYWSFLAIIFPPIFVIISLGILVFGFPEKDGKELSVVETRFANVIIVSVSLLIAIVSTTFLYRRLKSIRRIFAAGEFVVGIVNFIDFDKDRGRIEYAYIYNQQDFQGGSAVMKNLKTKDFQLGDEVILMVDPNKPKRALIQDLYT